MLTVQKIKNKLTTEDVIKLACHLQEDETYFYDAQGHPIFYTGLDHPSENSGSWKLYYYPETQLFHCFRSGTKVITESGIQEIQKLVGKSTKILNGNGEWEETIFKSYGVQKLMKITLQRNNKIQEIYATPEHEWLLKRKKGKVHTKDLLVGSYLERASFNNRVDVELDPNGIIHGYCYGDGSIIYKHKTRNDTRYRIIGYTSDKEKILSYLSKATRVKNIYYNTTKYDENRIYNSALFDSTIDMKEVPSINNSLNYLLGFLAGYFLADGCASTDRVSFCNVKEDDLFKIQDICTKCQILTTTISEEIKRQGYKSINKKFYVLRLVRPSIPSNFFITNKGIKNTSKINSVGRWRVIEVENSCLHEEVYCCETSTHSFALDGFILTGNCYTRGETYDVFELVKRAKEFDNFSDAFKFIVNFFHFKDNGKDEEVPVLTEDWDIFQSIVDFKKPRTDGKKNGAIQENLLDYFYPLAAPEEWQKEHITPEVMRYYGIRVDSALHKVIIPHRDIDGKLIGIRGRTYDPFELDEGKKYMPVFIQGDMYNHMLGKNLFGLYENKDTIRKIKKVLIVESEKGVMQCASYYGVNNCFCVATCGSSLSQDQINLLLQLGINEVILGYDREFEGKFGDQDTEEYEKKLMKLVKPLTLYFNTYIIMDYDHLTPYKASCTDCGKEILEKLMKQKRYIPPIHEDIRRKK